MIKNFGNILTGDLLSEESSLRRKENIEIKIDRDEIVNYDSSKWEVVKENKNGIIKISSLKDCISLLTDKVWMTFYKMGFKYINSNPIIFEYNNDGIRDEKEVHIVAIDDETCLFIDCFASKELVRGFSFEDKIIEMRNSFRFLCNDIRGVYGEKKCKYILATSNYILNDFDLDLIRDNKIIHFDDESINYYNNLVEHLGSAARFQLLGNLFSKTTIKGMEERIPAIEGRMGNLTYYSFLIEPERLLKIGYVLHRNKANRAQMPTYQRIIKKSRLKSVREFVNNGGFFPNSLIISIDTKGGKLRFDKAPGDIQGSHSRVGTLYLPKEYQSAYIIDGQHRLYGYSDSKYVSTDTIPVIAFVDLDKEKQVKMFMDINENQKPVSKTLRNVLNIDINWNSDVLTKRREAIMLSICQELGENTNSPLFGRVLTGEDSINELRCITIDYIKAALEKTGFFNKYNKKNEIIERGLFDRISSEETFERIYNHIRKFLQVIYDMCKQEWDKGSNGYLAINNTMYGIIRIISDMTFIVFHKNNYNIDYLYDDNLYIDCQYFLTAFTETLNSLPAEKRYEIKNAKGGSAKEVSYRILQVAFHEQCPTFINSELEKYIEENCHDYNEEALTEILFIRDKLVQIIKGQLINKLDWEKLYLDEEITISIKQKVIAAEVKNNRMGIENKVDFWEVVDLDDVCKILVYKTNWSTFFKMIFSAFTRLDLLSNIKGIQIYESRINSGKKITRSEYNNLHQMYEYIKGVN